MSGRNEQDGAEAMSRGRKPVCFLSRTESATLPAARPPETERELAMKTPSAKTFVGRRRPRPHHIWASPIRCASLCAVRLKRLKGCLQAVPAPLWSFGSTLSRRPALCLLDFVEHVDLGFVRRTTPGARRFLWPYLLIIGLDPVGRSIPPSVFIVQHPSISTTASPMLKQIARPHCARAHGE